MPHRFRWWEFFRAAFLLLCAACAVGRAIRYFVYQTPLDRALVKAVTGDGVDDNPEPETARRLLQQGANPDTRGGDNLGYASRSFTLNRALRRAFGRRDETALIVAVTQGQYGGAGDMAANLAELLASHGANVNARGAEGKTALMQACMYGRDEAAKVLISHHANVNLRTDEGETALMLAASHHGSVHTLRLLLASGAQVNRRDSDGRTALYYAEEEIKHEEPKNCDRIQLLKKAGGVL